MIGKTNLTFISKSGTSDVQLIQKSHVTDATENIYKMEVINNSFFAFVGKTNTNKNVLVGTGVSNLTFARKGNKNLEASHIIYTEGKYYIANAGDTCILYETVDFCEYEQLPINESEMWIGVFLDTRGRIVLASYHEYGSTKICIRVCDTLKDVSNAQISETSLSNTGLLNDAYATSLKDNRILFLEGRQISLAGQISDPPTKLTSEPWYKWNYAEGYFFSAKSESGRGIILYRSRDLVTATEYPNVLDGVYDAKLKVIPINGKFCLIHASSSGVYMNLADDVLSVGDKNNPIIEISDKLSITSVMEDDGKTYVGTSNGVIYEFQLDYEGTIQRPDVTIIKSLAAKQALAESLQYTDGCIADLKKYIDERIQEALFSEAGDSTGVEQSENID